MVMMKYPLPALPRLLLQKMEGMLNAATLVQPLNQSDIKVRTTIEESAQLFITIISGKELQLKQCCL
jgi:hypothetical protein